jgi:hypothetical protein
MREDPDRDVDDLGVVHPLRAPRPFRVAWAGFVRMIVDLPLTGRAFVLLAFVDVVARLIGPPGDVMPRIVYTIAGAVPVLLPAIVLAVRPGERATSPLLGGSILLALSELAGIGTWVSDQIIGVLGGDATPVLDPPRIAGGLVRAGIWAAGWLLVAYGSRSAWRPAPASAATSRRLGAAVVVGVLVLAAVTTAVSLGATVSAIRELSSLETALLFGETLLAPVVWGVVGVTFARLFRDRRSRPAGLATIGAVLELASTLYGSVLTLIFFLWIRNPLALGLALEPVVMIPSMIGALGPLLVVGGVALGLEPTSREADGPVGPDPAGAVPDPA